MKSIIESLVTMTGERLKTAGCFKLEGCLNLTLLKKPATPAREVVNTLPKEPRVFKDKPASMLVRAMPLHRFKEIIC